MTTPFTINATAQQIEDAILNVVNADPTPTSPSTKTVTSQGIKSYVDSAILGLDTTNIDQTKLIVDSEFADITTITTDTHLVTSKALKSYVASLLVPSVSVFSIAQSSNSSSPGSGFINNLDATRHPSNTEGVDGGGTQVSSSLTPSSITIPSVGTSYIKIEANFSGTSASTDEAFLKLYINGTEDLNARFGDYRGGQVSYLREVNASDTVTTEVYRGSNSSQQFSGKLYVYNYGT
jgi:hypothetical protein